MDIISVANSLIGVVTTPIGAAVTGVVAGIFGKGVTNWCYSKISGAIKPLLIKMTFNLMLSFGKNPEDKAFWQAVFQALIIWMEIKYPSLTGEEKKSHLVDKIVAYTGIKRTFADELVQLFYDDGKDVLDQLKAKIQQADIAQA